jgi:hypothetical protein
LSKKSKKMSGAIPGVVGDTMRSGETFASGQMFKEVGGSAVLQLQHDGNLVIYDKHMGKPKWASDTCRHGTGPYTLSLSAQGRLAWTDVHGAVQWELGPFGDDAQYTLRLVGIRWVLYKNDEIVWESSKLPVRNPWNGGGRC